MDEGRRNFDAEAAAWDTPARVKTADAIAEAVLTEVPLSSGMNVLDFGCGTGLLSLRLQPFVRNVICVDSSQGMLDVLEAKVRERGLKNVNTERLDIEAGDILRGPYDLIVSSLTLHHVKHVERLLGLFASVTAPGGTLCIADLDSEGGRFHADHAGVFHHGFDRSELRQAMLANGYEEVRDRTATVIEKANAAGIMESFSVFLFVARHP